MKLKYISWLPAVLIMGIIFFFSAKQSDDSNSSSMTIANNILDAYETITDTQYQGDARVETLGNINYAVRKTAHFCEYAILAAAFAFHLYVNKHRGKRLFIIPVVLTALYAATDEFHQTMVAGRSGQIRDVLLDTAGAATGSLCFFLIFVVAITKLSRKRG